MFTIGCDPEILFKDASGVFRSCVEKIPGTKSAPFSTQYGKIHYDNVAGEFNTQPANSSEAFSASVESVLAELQDYAAQAGLFPTTHSAAEFPAEELQHPDANTSGCEPDFNAWSGGMPNFAPPLEVMPVRCAGGHVHIGIDNLSEDAARQLVKLLDLFVTVPMLHHEDPMRRAIYGGAGAYRKKSYGVEYRTPSNFWIFTEARRKWLYSQVEKAITAFREGIEHLPSSLPAVINEHQLDAARELVSQFNLELCPE